MATKRMSKHTPGPWMVNCVQSNRLGQKSRPVIRDCRGRKIGSKVPDAALMAAAPALMELVASLADCVEMQALQIASALELSRVSRPLILTEARKALVALACEGVRP